MYQAAQSGNTYVQSTTQITQTGCVPITSVVSPDRTTTTAYLWYQPPTTGSGVPFTTFGVQTNDMNNPGPTSSSVFTVNVDNVNMPPYFTGTPAPITNALDNQMYRYQIPQALDPKGNPLSYYVTGPGCKGFLYQVDSTGLQMGAPIDATNGPVQITNPNRYIMFQSPRNVGGSPYCTIAFTANNGFLSSTPQLVPVTVTNVAKPPTAVGGTITTTQGAPALVNMFGNDFKGNPLTPQITALGPNGQWYFYDANAGPTNSFKGAQITTATLQNPVSVPGGKVVFVPNNGPGQYGPAFSYLKFRVSDGTLSSPEAQATINVVRSQTPPTIDPQGLQVPMDAKPYLYQIKASDSSSNDKLTYKVVVPPALGRLYQYTDSAPGQALPQNEIKLTRNPQTGVYNSVIVTDAQGRLIFVPPATVVGSASQPVRTSMDITAANSVTSSTATVPIILTPVATAPIFSSGNTINVPAGQVTTKFPISAFDSTTLPKDMTYVITSVPRSGQIYGPDGSPLAIGSTIKPLIDSQDGTPILPIQLSYTTALTPTGGTDNFGVKAVGSLGNQSPIQTVTFNVATPAPVPQPISGLNPTGPQDQPLLVWLGGKQPGATAQDLTAFITNPPQVGTLYQAQQQPDGSLVPDLSRPIMTPNTQVNRFTKPADNDGTLYPGAVFFVPGTGGYGNPYSQFGYSLRNNQGGSSPSSGVPVTITPTRRPPVAYPIAVNVDGTSATNTPIPIKLGGISTDGTPVTPFITSLPNFGTLSLTPNGPALTTVPADTQGDTVYYTAPLNYVGTPTFTYAVKDIQGLKSNGLPVTIAYNRIITGVGSTSVSGQSSQSTGAISTTQTSGNSGYTSNSNSGAVSGTIPTGTSTQSTGSGTSTGQSSSQVTSGNSGFTTNSGTGNSGQTTYTTNSGTGNSGTSQTSSNSGQTTYTTNSGTGNSGQTTYTTNSGTGNSGTSQTSSNSGQTTYTTNSGTGNSGFTTNSGTSNSGQTTQQVTTTNTGFTTNSGTGNSGQTSNSGNSGQTTYTTNSGTGNTGFTTNSGTGNSGTSQTSSNSGQTTQQITTTNTGFTTQLWNR